jgi:hypothetical protein
MCLELLQLQELVPHIRNESSHLRSQDEDARWRSRTRQNVHIERRLILGRDQVRVVPRNEPALERTPATCRLTATGCVCWPLHPRRNSPSAPPAAALDHPPAQTLAGRLSTCARQRAHATCQSSRSDRVDSGNETFPEMLG